jgi:hypothetical protein
VGRVGAKPGGSLGTHLSEPAVRSFAALSDAALRYGAALELRDAEELSVRLYGFHRYPLSPRLVATLPGAHQLRQFVLREGPAELTEYWRSQRYEGRAGWLHWIRRGSRDTVRHVTHKLYVSPPPTLIREAMRELVPLLTQSECLRFKIAATPSYLARPDKLVAYFDGPAETLRVGELLVDLLRGMPVHGVPFSCSVNPSNAAPDPTGPVSWGVDPPSTEEHPMSWRLWLCSEIAEAMIASEREARVAAARVRIESWGIDTTSWRPPPGLWQSDRRLTAN